MGKVVLDLDNEFEDEICVTAFSVGLTMDDYIVGTIVNDIAKRASLPETSRKLDAYRSRIDTAIERIKGRARQRDEHA